MNYKKIVFLFIMLNLTAIVSSYCQQARKHYLSPVWEAKKGGGIGEVFIMLSTFENEGFFVKIELGNGQIIDSVFISSSKPRTLSLGQSSSSVYVASDYHLNKAVSNKGIIVSGKEPFFANIRCKSKNQGASLTSKGTQALGKVFYTGQVIEGYDGSARLDDCGHFISVMATEDNTVVRFTNFKKGVSLLGQPTDEKGKNPTVKDIEITLNEGESYVVAERVRNMKIIDINKFYGIKVEASKPVTLSCGSALANSVYGGGFYDIGFDQIEPANRVGKEYFLVKGLGYDDMEAPVIVGTERNTKVEIKGRLDTEIFVNEGGFHILNGVDFNDKDNLYIKSDKPIYVYQNMAAGRCYCNQGFSFIPPLNFCSSMEDIALTDLHLISTETVVNIISKPSNTVTIYSAKGRKPLKDFFSFKPNFDEFGESGVEWTKFKYEVPLEVNNIIIESKMPVSVAVTFKSNARGVSTYAVGNTPEPKIYLRNPERRKLDFCKGDDITLQARLRKDLYDFQWYNGVDKVAKANQSNYKVSKPGEYILEVKDNSCQTTYITPQYFIPKCYDEKELVSAVDKTFKNEYHGDTTHIMEEKPDEEVVALHNKHKMLSKSEVLKSIERMLKEHHIDSALTLLELTFVSNSDELDEKSQLFFNELVKDFGYYGDEIEVHIIAHTDCIGSTKYNQTLSQKRASHIAEYFLEHGFDESAISSEGKGETSPIVNCDCDGSGSGRIECNEELLTLNRRLELQITERVK